MSYLLDSNIVVYYLNSALPANGMQMLNVIVDETPCISIITKMETLGFRFNSAADEDVAETFIGGSTVLNITDEVVAKTIEIRKMEKIKLPDAIL